MDEGLGHARGHETESDAGNRREQNVPECKIDQEVNLTPLRQGHKAPARVEPLEWPLDVLCLDDARTGIELHAADIALLQALKRDRHLCQSDVDSVLAFALEHFQVRTPGQE